MVEMLTGICFLFSPLPPLVCVKLHFDSDEMQHLEVTSSVKLC